MKYLIFLFYFVSVTFFQFIKSQDQQEYNCLVSIFTKTDFLNYINFNYSTSKYEFCNNVYDCSYNSFIHVSTSNIISNIEPLNGTDFQCLPYITDITLNNIKLGPNFLSTSFPSNFNHLEASLSNDFPFSKPSSNFNYISIDQYTQTINSTILFSWFSNTTYFLIKCRTKTNCLIYFENDLKNDVMSTWKPNDFDITSMNFPSFKNLEINEIFIELLPGYDKNSFENNIETIENLTRITVTSSDITNFPSNLGKINNLPNLISFTMPFLEPKSIIDISNISAERYNYKNLYFLDVGRSFSLNNGTFPFKLPKNLYVFHFRGGNINPIDLSVFKDVKYVILQDNQITNLPSTFDIIKYGFFKVDLSYNIISGTLDSSFCARPFDIRNNSLTGELPFCVTCFWDQNVRDYLSGNQFTNYENPPPCSNIVPGGIGKWIEGNGITNSIQIFGQNLGMEGVSINITLLNVPGAFCNFDGQQLSLFCSYYPYPYTDIITPPNIIELSYTDFNFTFTLSPDPLKPRIETVYWYDNSSTNNTNLVLNGSYFSYNKTIINIIVGNRECIVSSTTFYQINCTIYSSDFTNSDHFLTYVTVGDLLSQITLTPNIINVVVNCSGELNDCNGNGYCDTSVGKCICFNPQQTIEKDCLIVPLHYVSSIIPCTIIGGNASFIGNFTTRHSNLSITIDDLPCPILYESETLIICNSPPGIGIKSVNVTQNMNVFFNKDLYQYNNPIQSCPNDCSNNGKCTNTNGECECNSGFTSFDCSVEISSKSNNNKNQITIDNNYGGANITNQEVEFFIYFKSLYEIDFNGNIIKSYELKNHWLVVNDKAPSSNFTFTQTLDNGCTIISNIVELTSNNEYSFADTKFKLNLGDMKFSISINNYLYQSNLNNLKLDLLSSFDLKQQKDSNECNFKETKIESIKDESSIFNYIKISKNNKILFARFLNKLISDGKSTFLSISSNNLNKMMDPSLSQVIVSFNLPYCIECIIDPDFSVLLDSDYKDSCNNNNNNDNKWVLPVAIIVPVIVISIIVVITVVYYKKNSIEIDIKSYKLKRFRKNLFKRK